MKKETVLFPGLLAKPELYTLPDWASNQDVFHLPLHDPSAPKTHEEGLEKAQSLQSYKNVIAHSAGAIYAIKYLQNHDADHIVFIEPAGQPYYSSISDMLGHWLRRSVSYTSYLKTPDADYTCGQQAAIFGVQTLGKLLLRPKQLRTVMRKNYSSLFKNIQQPVHVIWCSNGLYSADYQNTYEEKLLRPKTQHIQHSHGFPVCATKKEVENLLPRPHST